jgi:hypothetical protein
VPNLKHSVDRLNHAYFVVTVLEDFLENAALGSGGGPHPLVGGGVHTAAGLTAGDVLTALTPTTFGFSAPTGGGGSGNGYMPGGW